MSDQVPEEDDDDDLSSAEPTDATASRIARTSTRRKLLAGLMAGLLLLAFGGSLLGGTRNQSPDTTTSAPSTGTTPTTADREMLVAAAVALAATMTPAPAGDVELAGIDAPHDQDAAEAALVDVVATGWYDRADGTRFAFVITRGGPPDEVAGCFELTVTDTSAAGTAAQGEINLGGPCAVHGAFEQGRKAGFLLPVGALWILDLEQTAGAGPPVAGLVAIQLFRPDGATLVDTAAVPLDRPPVAADLADALLPLLNFRDADPPDGVIAPRD